MQSKRNSPIRLTKSDLKKEIELWIDIPDTEGNYQVSSRNRVKSMSRRVKFFKRTRLTESKIMIPQCDIYNNTIYILSINGKQKNFISKYSKKSQQLSGYPTGFIKIINQYRENNGE